MAMSRFYGHIRDRQFRQDVENIFAWWNNQRCINEDVKSITHEDLWELVEEVLAEVSEYDLGNKRLS